MEVIVPRLGGGYGGKGSRSSQIACACAVVAYKLNRTATLVMPIVDNMAAVGKRQECELDYEVSCDKDYTNFISDNRSKKSHCNISSLLMLTCYIKIY